MRNIRIIAKREIAGYFGTPLAYVFLVIFLSLTAALAFYLGGLLDVGQADLAPFFVYHPWLYLLLVPAVAMRLWAEERKTGTIENLLTLPVSTPEVVLGKFLAAWFFCGIALALTFPIWITRQRAGRPGQRRYPCKLFRQLSDGRRLYGNRLLHVGADQESGHRLHHRSDGMLPVHHERARPCARFLRGWAPDWFVATIASLSFLTHFNTVTKGVIELRDLIFFVALIAFWLFANIVVVETRKAA